MKIVIAGGRDYIPTMQEEACIAEIFSRHEVTEIIQGGATGVDSWARDLARKLGIKCITFMPDWEKHGKVAGPLRNCVMANYADACILLKGGRGTASMRREAIKASIPILYDANETEHNA